MIRLQTPVALLLWKRGVLPPFFQIFKPEAAPNKTGKEEKFLSVSSSFEFEQKQPGCQVPQFFPTSAGVPEILPSKWKVLISVKMQREIIPCFNFVTHSLHIAGQHEKHDVSILII